MDQEVDEVGDGEDTWKDDATNSEMRWPHSYHCHVSRLTKV